MIKYIIGAVLLAAVVGIGANYIVMSERAKCDARIAIAIAKFEKLQTDVKQVVEEYEKVVDIEKGDKDDAAILKEIMARLHTAASKNTPSQCLIDPADVTDAGRLRDGPASAPKRGKASRAVVGGL